MKIFISLAFSFFALVASPAGAFTVPTLTGPVMDQADMIDAADEARLDKALRAANSQGVVQLQVLTVQSLEGDPIEDVSYEIVKTWRLGEVKSDNGVLFLISKGDRRLRIEVGQGLEGAIPDIYAKRIVSDIVIPYFREGQTSQGILAGANAILELATGEKSSTLGESRVVNESRGKSSQFYLNLLIFIIVLIVAILQPRRRGLVRGGYYGGLGGGWGGGLGRRSGGGGWSGGGGGFSGGGASGGW